jgi:hypothetical protein
MGGQNKPLTQREENESVSKMFLKYIFIFLVTTQAKSQK